MAEFVQHMNPLGVLTLGDIMQPPRGEPPVTLPAETPVRAALDRFVGSDAGLGVSRDGALVGLVTKDDILRALAAAPEAPAPADAAPA